MVVGFALRRHVDRWLAIALASALAIELWVSGPPVPGPDLAAERISLLVGTALIVSIAWRRRFPLVVLALAVMTTLIAPEPPVDGPVAIVLAIVVATFTAGSELRDRSALIGAAGVAAILVVAIVKDLAPDTDPADITVPMFVLGGPWLVGISVRARREREVALEQARIEEAASAVADERARIARELHDAVAHAMGIIVLQARGGRRILERDPALAREAFDTIEATGGQALDEMRRLVGVLREEGDAAGLAPLPGLRDVGSLVERVRIAGLPVTLTVEGTPTELPTGIDLSAYRIVQEALSNVLAHAGPATADVRIRYTPDRLELEVADTGIGLERGADGHGLVGMRERVSLYHGSLETGARPGGGLVVIARLPLEPATT